MGDSLYKRNRKVIHVDKDFLKTLQNYLKVKNIIFQQALLIIDYR
jgi:hypothetical protein